MPEYNDLLIINPRMMMNSTSSVVCNGPISLASYLAAKGIKVRVIDDNSVYRKYGIKDYIASIQKLKPTVIGLSINILNASEAYDTLKILRKEFPGKIIIAGGLHSYCNSSEILDQGFDVVFVGEAEYALHAFLDLIDVNKARPSQTILTKPKIVACLKHIPGLMFRDDRQMIDTGPGTLIEDLDELPFINHDLLNLNDYIKYKFDLYNVANAFNFQRGCPFECIYCKSNYPGKIRNNSAKYIFDQLRLVIDKYQFDQFNLLDSNFPLDKKRLHEFCHLMIGSGLNEKIKLWCQTSVTIPLDDHDLDLLKKAGVSMISVGIERLSGNFRSYMNKRGSTEQAFDIIHRIKMKGIKTNVNILVNFPIDTVEAIAEESRLLTEMLPYIDYYAVNYLVPIPGTKLYDESGAYHRWYLRPGICHKRLSYYDLAYNVTTAGVEFNLFGLSDTILASIRKFKEQFYRKTVITLDNGLLFRCAFYLDVYLASVSYSLYQLSSRLEHTVFFFPKLLRRIGFKYMINRFFYSKA